MTDLDMTTGRSDFEQRFEALSRRVDEKLRELHKTGTFSETNKKLADRFKSRREEVAYKLNAVPRSGTRWSRLKEELVRDFKALSDDLRTFENSMDADAMKNRNR